MLQVQGAGVGYNRGYQQPRGPQYYADRGCVPLALASGDSRLGTKVGDFFTHGYGLDTTPKNGEKTQCVLKWLQYF